VTGGRHRATAAETRLGVAVIIVSHNSAANLVDCLTAVHAAADDDVDLRTVVLADNASTDASVDLAHATADRLGLPLRVLPMGRNAGYAAAINAAGELIGPTDHVLVLNPDAHPRPGSLAALVHAADRPDAGLAVPRLLAPDGATQPSLRRAPSITRALAEALLGGPRAGRWGEVVTDPRAYAVAGPTTWATGAVLLVSAAAWRDIGPWDERFLLYSEETEYALRAAERGWTVRYEPAAEVAHAGGDSGRNPMLWALLTVNRVRLYRDRHSPAATAAFYLAVLLGQALRAAAGRRTARAAVLALLLPSHRIHALPG
jgi:N-acetylglucosaminyl-diphospho-decaprenol L-rhamnosyltransferase